MGKCLAGRDRPGASAAAEGRRAQLDYRRRRRLNAALMVIGAALAGTGVVLDRPWLDAAAVGAVALWGRGRPVPDPQRWERGAEAERATAQILARLPRRFLVLHDRRPPGRIGNIDHLVIAPRGVSVVDSKARRAPLAISRGQVWAGEQVIDTGPVTRQANEVSRLLGVPVAAIVAVYGNGLRGRGKKVGAVRVVPATTLLRVLRTRKGRGRRLPQPSRVALAVKAEQLLPPCE